MFASYLGQISALCFSWETEQNQNASLCSKTVHWSIFSLWCEVEARLRYSSDRGCSCVYTTILISTNLSASLQDWPYCSLCIQCVVSRLPALGEFLDQPCLRQLEDKTHDCDPTKIHTCMDTQGYTYTCTYTYMHACTHMHIHIKKITLSFKIFRKPFSYSDNSLHKVSTMAGYPSLVRWI